MSVLGAGKDDGEPPQEEECNLQRLREPLLDLEEREEQNEDERLVDGMPLWTSVLLKSLYFLDALGACAWGRFGTIYYNLHGLNSQQIGLMEGLMPAVRTLVQPLWGMFADRHQCRKAVYLCTKLVSTVILLLLSLPMVYSSFIGILAVSLSTMLFASSGILDAYTLDLLGTRHKLRYGRYRMFSAISWGLGAVMMGYMTDHYGFEPNFIIYATIGAISFVLVAWRIPNIVVNHQEENGVGLGSHGQWMELFRLLVRPRVLIFALENIVIGAGIGTVERLLFLYLVNDLGASTLLCGLTVGVNVLIELPIFWYAQDLMAVLGGHDGMFAVSMVCFIVRVFGYTLLTPETRWFMLPLEALHGLTFACFWVATTDVAKVLIHQVKGGGWNTTIPTVVQTMYDAFGIGLGSIVGGWAMHRYGSRIMYRGMASIMLLTLIVHGFGSIASRFLFQKPLLPDYDDTLREQDERVQEDEEHPSRTSKEREGASPDAPNKVTEFPMT